MTIEIALLSAVLLMIFAWMIVFAIFGIVWLLIDHPFALFSIITAFAIAALTVYFYAGGNAK